MSQGSTRQHRSYYLALEYTVPGFVENVNAVRSIQSHNNLMPPRQRKPPSTCRFSGVC